MKTSRGRLRTPQRTPLFRQPRKLRGPTGRGSVTLSGEFLAAHRDEILERVLACERAENRRHPLKRIMALSSAGRELRIATTDVRLARRIGEALRRAYKGKLEYRYHKADSLLRVAWRR
jgi:hypothetical protein